MNCGRLDVLLPGWDRPGRDVQAWDPFRSIWCVWTQALILMLTERQFFILTLKRLVSFGMLLVGCSNTYNCLMFDGRYTNSLIWLFIYSTIHSIKLLFTVCCSSVARSQQLLWWIQVNITDEPKLTGIIRCFIMFPSCCLLHNHVPERFPFCWDLNQLRHSRLYPTAFFPHMSPRPLPVATAVVPRSPKTYTVESGPVTGVHPGWRAL